MNEGDIKLLKRGRGTVLLEGGHQYYFQKKYRQDETIWRCKHYKLDLKCKGSVTLSKDRDKVIKRKPHSEQCQPDYAGNCIDATINEFSDKAAKGEEPAPKVFKRAIAQIATNRWDLLTDKPTPSFKEKKSSIYRQRNKAACVKKTNSKIANEVEVPQQYLKFLLDDYCDDIIRILVFCNETGKDLLKTCKVFFMDGTYKSCPEPFRQIYVIHGDLGSDVEQKNIVPIAFAFMTHQSEKAYSILFERLKLQIPDWHPDMVMTDFEQAAICALTKIGIKVTGCHYHFLNALRRKAKSLGLKKTRDNQRIVHLVSNLALLPPDTILEGWDYILREINSDVPALEQFKNYFETTWLKSPFKDILSVFALQHRTNNAAEGWHHNLNSYISRNKPNFLQILHFLFQESLITNFRTNKLQNFDQSTQPKRAKQHIDSDRRIMDAQTQLIVGEISVGHFLEKLRY